MQRRSVQRQTIDAECHIRSRAIMPQRVTLADMSNEGCALRSFRLRLRRQDAVELDLPSVGRIAAEVRWVRMGEGVGLRFARPLQVEQVAAIVREAQRAAIMGSASRNPIVFDQPKLRRPC
jgi:hypothetical protein